MSDAVLAVEFALGAVVSVGTSWLLVSRLERIGARLGLSEALLGVLAALAADAPELTAAVTALAQHQSRIGAGVVIGSNVFNLAALLGVGALVAGSIALHRRVIVLEGAVALAVATVCVLAVTGLISAPACLAVALLVLIPYLVVLGVHRGWLRRLGLPSPWVRWLAGAVAEEELELQGPQHPRPARGRDAAVAAAGVVVVVAASIVMEQAASKFGGRHAVPQIVIGGLVLAAVTSLPNAVAAVYLASRGRGAATLSTAMNSNALNVAAGLLLPASFVGLGMPSGPATLVALYYLGLTVFVLTTAFLARGLRREHAVLIICAYLSFAGLLLSITYSSTLGVPLSIAVPAVSGVSVAIWLVRRSTGQNDGGSAAGGDGNCQPETSAAPAASPRNGARLDCADRANGNQPAVAVFPGHEALLPGWSIQRVWYLAIAISTLIAIADAILGHHVILIGLLIAGPCCGLLTGRTARTATAGAWAIVLAVVLGVPDQIWGTWTHFVFLGAVVIVAAVTTTSAAVLQRHR